MLDILKIRGITVLNPEHTQNRILPSFYAITRKKSGIRADSSFFASKPSFVHLRIGMTGAMILGMIQKTYREARRLASRMTVEMKAEAKISVQGAQS